MDWHSEAGEGGTGADWAQEGVGSAKHAVF